MVLLERRIGLLFGLFLGLLLLAGARALWIGGVRGQELSGRAAAQQVQEITVPARRRAITERNPGALRGEDGRRRIVSDAVGQPASIVDQKVGRPGHDIKLTIDAAIQERTEAVLNDVGQTFQPRGAMAMVLDPRTGEILALANWPAV